MMGAIQLRVSRSDSNDYLMISDYVVESDSLLLYKINSYNQDKESLLEKFIFQLPAN
jgi:hypothetical protein